MDMKIAEKVQKLLALTESSNEHEAALAAEKAHALLAEHNLSMAQVESATTNKQDTIGHSTATSKLGARWVRSVWQATARLYFCEYMFSSGNHKTHHYVIGSEANTATTCQMAEFFTQTVVKMSKGYSGSSQSSFRTGCALRLVGRLNAMRGLAQKQQDVATSCGTTLPVLYEQTKKKLDEYISETWGKTKAVPSKNFSIADSKAYASGRDAANTIGLNKQTTHNSSKAKELTHG